MNTRSRRQVRVKSKLRFLLFIMLLMFGMVTGINQMLGLNEASAAVEPVYVQTSVGSGETLWDIANRYRSPEVDVRRAVYIIKCENDLTSSDVAPGMKLTIPVSALK